MGEGKSLFCGINRKGDEAEQAMQEKHLPDFIIEGEIKAKEAFDVKLDTWGGGKHPNTNEHFIQWVELYAGEVFVTRVEFTPVVSNPVVTIPITLHHPGETELRAISRCNLHGLWESKTTVKVG